MPLEAIKADILADLPGWKAEYEKFGKFIAAAEELVGETVAAPDEAGSAPRTRGPRPTIRPDEFTGMSTSEAVRAFLELMGKGNPQGPREMAKALVAGGRDSDEAKAYTNVTSVLKRMKAAKEIQQVRRGQWGLSKWYGGSAPTRKPKAKQNGDAERNVETESLAEG